MDTLRVDPSNSPGIASAARSESGADDPRFGKVLSEIAQRVNTDQLEAEEQARSLAAGEGDIVETMIAINRADLSMRFAVTLRNRALDAYQEIMRLQV